MKTLILASGSPRRKELISLLPWPFMIHTNEVEEKLDPALPMEENVKTLALQKALAAAKDYPDHIVIGADTMVCLEGEMLGKPDSEKQAAQMLGKLSGRTHQVMSGVAVVCLKDQIQECFCETTKVKMQELSQEEIKTYIRTKEPLDKAGSYAIQGIGSRYIEGIEGDYFNVVGLPVHKLYEALTRIQK